MAITIQKGEYEELSCLTGMAEMPSIQGVKTSLEDENDPPGRGPPDTT